MIVHGTVPPVDDEALDDDALVEDDVLEDELPDDEDVLEEDVLEEDVPVPRAGLTVRTLLRSCGEAGWAGNCGLAFGPLQTEVRSLHINPPSFGLLAKGTEGAVA